MKLISSPTSKGLLDRMMRPVNRFSKISRPARPTARPPTPPMASTELTAPHSPGVDRRSCRAWAALHVAMSERCRALPEMVLTGLHASGVVPVVQAPGP